MSLAQKMKLQDLKVKVKELSTPRWELLNKQIDTAATTIQQAILAYFTSKGFIITGQMPKVKAMYNGGLDTSIDFSNLKGNLFGCDGAIELKYDGKEFVLYYLTSRGNAPEQGGFCGSKEESMQNEINYYEEKLIPYLQSVGVSDLSGGMDLYSRTSNAVGRPITINYPSVEEALDSFID
ncbi:hypothetical protein NMD75_15460 [Edwardsiella tarda]